MYTNPAIKPYKLKNGDIRYMFKIYLGVDPVTGKEVSTTRRTFKTTREAQTIYDRLKNDYREGTYKKQQYITYEEVYEAWKVNYRKKVKPSTFLKTTRLFQNHILPAIGNLRIDKITFAICENHSYYWVEKFERFKSIISYASRVMTHAIKLGYIQTDPFKLVETPKQRKSSNGDKYYSRDELISFLEAAKNEGNTMIYAFYRILAYTGMRKSECLALQWCDIESHNKEIYVYSAISFDEERKLSLSETKTGGTRIIKIDSETLEILKVWQKEQIKISNDFENDNDLQLVFPNTKNHLIQPSLTWKWGRDIQEKYGLPYLSPHGFRHTHPTLLTEAGASLVGIQQRLGHSGRDTTTKTYIHHTDKIMDDTLNLFVEYMNY